jgi:acetylornithine deacetylase/succinyl-diaminopimelate desuccinylase-like protein
VIAFDSVTVPIHGPEYESAIGVALVRGFFKPVATLAHSMWPGVPIMPTMATGFSDDRQTRNAGIPSYDISGIWIEEGENRARGRDERVSVRAFDQSVEFTHRLMKSMGNSR